MDVTHKTMSDEVVFENRGTTQIKTVKFRYIWTISNFSFYCKTVGDKIESPKFLNNDKFPGLTWYLEMNRNGWYRDDKSDVSYMSLHLHLASCNGSEFETNFKLSILNTKSEEMHTFEDNKSFGLDKFYGNNSFIEKVKLLNERAKIFPDDKLTILCDITALGGILNISETFKPPAIENLILNDLEFLLQNPSSLSDVTLVSGEKEFQAHKAILAARSSVFKDMFDADTEERQQNRFELKNINHEVLDKMLHYIYTDKASDLDKFGPDLLTAAEKYGLNGLTARCVNAMCTNLSVENASEFLILGDKYRQVELKEQAKFYICTRALEVIKTVGWKLMSEKHPHLITELFCVMAASEFTSARPTFTFGTETQNVQDATCAKPVMPTYKTKMWSTLPTKGIRVSKRLEKDSSPWPVFSENLLSKPMEVKPVIENSPFSGVIIKPDNLLSTFRNDSNVTKPVDNTRSINSN